MDTSVYKNFLIGYIVFQIISIIMGLLLFCALIMSIGMLILMGGSTGSIISFIFACAIAFLLIGLTFCYICISPLALYATYKTLKQRPLTKIQEFSVKCCPAILAILTIVLLVPFLLSLFL